MESYTTWLKSVRYYSKSIKVYERGESATDRQERVVGFSQSVMGSLKVIQIGAGGLGGEIAQGLLRKGIGLLKIFDGDVVGISNLSRQLFYEEDLYKNKAISLGKNLIREGINGTQIISYPFMFQRAVEEKIDISCDVMICAPDNDEVRIFTAKYFYKKVPVIFVGLDQHANTGYIFIQEPGKACLGCALPHTIRNKRESCPNTPAIIDIVKIIAGFVLFAVDSTVMERKRNWNYRQIFIAAFTPEISRNVERKENCFLCRG